jgi:hypothetical protein
LFAPEFAYVHFTLDGKVFGTERSAGRGSSLPLCAGWHLLNLTAILIHEALPEGSRVLPHEVFAGAVKLPLVHAGSFNWLNPVCGNFEHLVCRK